MITLSEIAKCYCPHTKNFRFYFDANGISGFVQAPLRILPSFLSYDQKCFWFTVELNNSQIVGFSINVTFDERYNALNL